MNTAVRRDRALEYGEVFVQVFQASLRGRSLTNKLSRGFLGAFWPAVRARSTRLVPGSEGPSRYCEAGRNECSIVRSD